MIRLEIKGNKEQTITNVCNECGRKIKDLELQDIVVAPKPDMSLTLHDSEGKDITRTEIDEDLKISKCENCA